MLQQQTMPAWQSQQQQLLRKRHQRRLQQPEQVLELVRALEQPWVLALVQELLLSYRKQPKQRRRQWLPKRETCSFLLSLMIKENNFRKLSEGFNLMIQTVFLVRQEHPSSLA